MEPSKSKGRTVLAVLRMAVGVLLCLVPLLAITITLLTDRLLKAGVLNTMDMAPVVGNQTGTVSEYLLNIWHWDAAGFLLLAAALPSVVAGITLLTWPKFGPWSQETFH